MSQKASATGAESFMTDTTAQFTENFKTFGAWQWKAGQYMMDQVVKYNQMCLDLNTEAIKTGMATAETLRKEVSTATSKFFAS